MKIAAAQKKLDSDIADGLIEKADAIVQQQKIDSATKELMALNEKVKSGRKLLSK